MAEYIDNVKLNGVSIPIRDSSAHQEISEMKRQSTGNGIESAVMIPDYSLTLAFTDGTVYTTPSLRGAPGADGHGVPTGGSAGQLLRKHSASNYDVEWSSPERPVTVNMGSVSTLPVTKNVSGVTADMVVIAHEFGTPDAFSNDLTVTTGNGTVTLSGSISGSSTVKLTLARAGTVSAS